VPRVHGSPAREPYRVVVCGTGRMGQVAISTVAARSDFELVGARLYSAEKHGVDAGELAGIDALGVTATSDGEEALRVEADCILHLARDFGRYDAVEEIVPLLLAGRNVITVHAFQFEHAMAATSCPPDTIERIQEACADGGATFHATGIHPEMIAARMVGTLTGLSTDIVSIKFSENWDVRDRDARTLSVMGYGRPPEELEANSKAIAQFADNYGLQSLYGLSRLLGVELVRVEHEHDFAAAPVDLSFRDMSVPAGSVARLTRRNLGYASADATTAFVTAEVNWMVGRSEMVPAGMNPDHHYFASIEGTPSPSMGIDIRASNANGQRLMDPDDPSSDPGYWATIATVLQAVPRVCAAPPGILDPVAPALHWLPDFRELERGRLADYAANL
jgi:hypothetical protein